MLPAANQIALRIHTSLRPYSGQDHQRHDPDVVEVVRTCGSGFRALLSVYIEFMSNQKSSNLNLQKQSNPLGVTSTALTKETQNMRNSNS